MYLEYFELKEQPFQLTPDPNFLYLSSSHARAKAYMDYSVWNHDGIVVITGEIGSGKTMLIQSLLSEIDDSVLVAKIHQTQLSELEFLQAVLVEFGFKPFNTSKVELLHLFNTFLLDQHEQGRQIVLIIDEAQNLSKRVLEELRLMTGLEADKGNILNLILVGQPELKEELDAPGMEQLNQRIRFRFHLKALSAEETEEYILHRLKIAGRVKDGLFPAATMPQIHRYTGGIPRLINTLCDTALIIAMVEEQTTITTEVIEETIAELQWLPYRERLAEKIVSISQAIRNSAEQLPRLIHQDNEGHNQEYALERDYMNLGRFSGNDIVLEDRSVSGHHAKIITIEGRSFLEDLNSTNGTYVNSERINRRVLKNGDVISLARGRLRYIEGAQTSTTAENPGAPKLSSAPLMLRA